MDSNNKTVVNARQIKAARALIDWSQEDLAQATGLSIATIRKIESGHISPRDKTMGAIITALEQSKIEFMSSGARIRDNDVTILEGEDCYLQLLDDIYYATRGKKSEVLFLYADGRLSTETENNAEVRIRKEGVRWRFLCEEGNTHMQYPLEEWRWLPKKFFKRNIQVVYGSKVAMGSHIDKSRNLTTKIVIIDSILLAESTKNLFEFLWENCRKPSHSTAPKIYD